MNFQKKQHKKYYKLRTRSKNYRTAHAQTTCLLILSECLIKGPPLMLNLTLVTFFFSLHMPLFAVGSLLEEEGGGSLVAAV